MKNLSVYICILITFFVLGNCHHPTKLEFQPAFSHIVGIDVPVDMDYQSNNIYVTSLNGQVYKFANVDTVSSSTVFLDLTASTLAFYHTGLVGDEGLLSIEFHPNYPSVPKFYAAYTPTPTTLAIVAFTVNTYTGAITNLNTPDVLFNITRPLAKVVGPITEAYLGGDLRFQLEDSDDDDDDNGCSESGDYNLLISIGYCNSNTVTQNPTTLLGKVLRVTPRQTGSGYTIPSTNPKVNGQTSVIYARGFRNPRKMYFSEDPSYLFLGDVGDVYDEINVVQKNKNYGWNIVEGCSTSSLYTNPIYDYTSSDAHAITQGPFYDDGEIKSLRNRMLFADLYSGQLYSIQSNNIGASCSIAATPVASAPALISSILVVDDDVIVCNVIGSYYGLPIFYRLVEVPV